MAKNIINIIEYCFDKACITFYSRGIEKEIKRGNVYIGNVIYGGRKEETIFIRETSGLSETSRLSKTSRQNETSELYYDITKRCHCIISNESQNILNIPEIGFIEKLDRIPSLECYEKSKKRILDEKRRQI